MLEGEWSCMQMLRKGAGVESNGLVVQAEIVPGRGCPNRFTNQFTPDRYRATYG